MSDAVKRPAIQWPRLLLIGAVTAGLFGLVFAFVPVRSTLDALSKIRPETLAIVLFLSTLFNGFFYSERWRRTLSFVGIRTSLVEVLRVHIGTGPIRLLFPIHTGELATAAFLSRRNRASLAKVAGTILYNKYLTLMASLILLASGLAAGSVESPLAGAVMGGSCLFLLLFLILETKAARGTILRVAAALGSSLHEQAGKLLAVYDKISFRAKIMLLGYAIVMQFSEVACCYFIFHDLGIILPPGQLIAYVQIMILASIIPVSIAGAGTREGMALVLLGPVSTPEAAVAAGLAYSMFEYFWPLIMGLPLTGFVAFRPIGNDRNGD